ncbi:MAG: hypothetical protein ACOC2F_02725 [Bacteroidota bacterium]
MANSKQTKGSYRQIIVDTDPGANGYWCEPVQTNKEGADYLFFAMEDSGGDATVTIQFKQPGGAWTDLSHSETIEDGAAFVFDTGSAPLSWRIGVKDNNQGTGTVRAGLYWNR